MQYSEIIAQLEAKHNPRNVAGMARFGITPKTRVIGVSMPVIREIGKKMGKNHALAMQLWKSGIHEARILAALVAEPGRMNEKDLDAWAISFDSWDVCDQTCSNLFDKTPYAWKKAVEWSGRREEFVKRAGFVLMAALAVHDKAAADKEFLKFLPIIKKHSTDERNFVRKAVNWALRQIGKRSLSLNGAAIKTAQAIARKDSRPAKWIAADALRELQSGAVQKRLKSKQSKR
jgi:3-methyladenine DNA glycosylase AlkD